MRKVVGEFLGTLILALAVVGSGAMATSLTADVALQLLINAAATGAILWLIINLFSEVSGAHFNPIVSVISLYRKELSVKDSAQFITAQMSGAIVGTLLANTMFNVSLLTLSSKVRDGWNLLLSETIATAGLIFLIFHLVFQGKDKKIAGAVSVWIFAAYFFTSSTSFANPAITIGRIFTDSFAGVAAHSALTFIPFQLIGGVLGYWLALFLNPKVKK
jgi:glycerol uptake facilitator-like aquaporin